MNFRFAKLADLSEVISWIDSLEEAQTWAGPSVSFPIRVDRVAREIEFSPETGFVCEDNTGLCAFAQLLNRSEGQLHISRLIANPRSRGKGVGRFMCKLLISEAKACKATSITLKVYAFNNRALRLYQSLGFKEERNHGEPEIVDMILDLSKT